MKKHLYRYLLSFFLLVSFVHWGESVCAKDDSLKWRIKSLYTDPLTGRSLSPVIWEYLSKKTESGKTVSVADSSGRTAFRSELFFNKENHLHQIDIYTRIGGKEKKIPRKFNPDYPVMFDETIIPSNCLNAPLPWDEKSKVYKVVRKIGSSASFSRQYYVKGKVIKIKEAMDLKLISDTFLNLDILSPELLLVTIEQMNVNGPDEEITTQLWSKNVDFWLYEKTPFRESWYVTK